MIEHCLSTCQVVANTFLERPPERQVTYYDIGSQPMGQVEPARYAEIDHTLVGQEWQDTVLNIHSSGEAALQTHHYLVLVEIGLNLEHRLPRRRQAKWDASALSIPSVQLFFTDKFCHHWDQLASQPSDDLNDRADSLQKAMLLSAQQSIPCRQACQKRPWITARTLELIELRDGARANNQVALMQAFQRQIRLAAKADRRAWLNELTCTGAWAAIHKLRKPKAPRQGRLQDLSGKLVDSNERAQTMADYLARVQWKPHLMNETSEGMIDMGPKLDVKTQHFDMSELEAALTKLKYGKTPGRDDIPVDFWKVLAQYVGAKGPLLDICNECWEQKAIPKSWAHAKVTCLFKKGCVELPSNYRPISLLASGYKVLATMLHTRLVTGGAEGLLRDSQFGFRKQRRTTDPIFVAQRLIDNTWVGRDSKLSMIFMDWAKAFDKVNPKALLTALSRFGVPDEMVDMIAGIYAQRTFSIQEAGAVSEDMVQGSGIAQGCPLSPYLFIIMLTVLFFDIDREVSVAVRGVWYDLAYADDTALACEDPGSLQLILHVLIDKAAKYGLTPNWDKTVHMPIRHAADICRPDGIPVRVVDKAVYLGAVLCASSRSNNVARQVGEARSTFGKLEVIWKHANLSRQRKINVFNSVVVPKVIYGLEPFLLIEADRKRLDAFQNFCLRKIAHIPHSMVSRVSNEEVRCITGQTPLSRKVLQQQLVTFGRIAAMPNGSCVRKSIFRDESHDLLQQHVQRRRGRPRLQWSNVMTAMAANVAMASRSRFEVMCAQHAVSLAEWKVSVKRYCFT